MVIWLILGLAPFVLAGLWILVHDPAAFFSIIATAAGVGGLLLLACYGAWEIGWVDHCGTFWESFSCH